ncbi:MAG: branched-chain amino acid ABC transporter permease [Bacillota bacterium]|nr:branched-chain amino acid ABC transporter permease [Bacillota bacterium]
MQELRKERLDRGVKVRCDSIYAVSSLKEVMFLVGPGLALVLILLVLPLVVSPYWQRVLSITGIYVLLSIGFGFLANYVGLVCLGGALFVGVGGYLSGIMNSVGVPMILSIPIAAFAGAVICTVLLLPCLPLRGVYFAIVSFVYPLLAARLIAATGIFGGTDGIAGLDVLTNRWFNIYLIFFVLLVAIFFMSRLVNYEDLGLVFRGVKDNEQAIIASGINITWYKAQAVFIAAFLGCFGGAYLTHLYGWVGMSLFAIDFSILPVAATVVGGSGILYGPLLGTFLLVPLSEMMRDYGTLRIVFYAVILVFFVVFWTEGIMEYLRRKYEQFEHWVRV